MSSCENRHNQNTKDNNNEHSKHFTSQQRPMCLAAVLQTRLVVTVAVVSLIQSRTTSQLHARQHGHSELKHTKYRTWMVVLKPPWHSPISAHTFKKARLVGIVLPAANATSAALCVTDRASVQSTQQRKSAHTDFGLQRYKTLVYCLMVSTAVIHVITMITTHLPSLQVSRMAMHYNVSLSDERQINW